MGVRDLPKRGPLEKVSKGTLVARKTPYSLVTRRYWKHDCKLVSLVLSTAKSVVTPPKFQSSCGVIDELFGMWCGRRLPWNQGNHSDRSAHNKHVPSVGGRLLPIA